MKRLGIWLLLLWAPCSAPADDFSKDAAKAMAEAGQVLASPLSKGPDLDRTRGRITFESKEGRYESGNHFGKWSWPEFTGERPGDYEVQVTYASLSPAMGFQFFIGKQKARGQLRPTGSIDTERTLTLGRLTIPDRGTYPVGGLSGDDSQGSFFRLSRITLVPTPRGGRSQQSIDGTATLQANSAATFSRFMHYDSRTPPDCLSHWVDPGDWAEWLISLHQGGRFRLEVAYGCSGENSGSKVNCWLGDQLFAWEVEDTGGPRNWKSHSLGVVDLGPGDHRVVIKPLDKKGEAVLDLRAVTLTPLLPPS